MWTCLFTDEIRSCSSSSFSFRDIPDNFTLFAKICFMNKEIRVFGYLRLDRHRMVPISVRRFRVLEGFPIRIQPRERRPIMSRLSRVYLEQAYVPWYRSYRVNRFGQWWKIEDKIAKSWNSVRLLHITASRRHLASNSKIRNQIADHEESSVLNRLIDCPAAASLDSLVSCTCSARMRHSVIVFI